MKSNGRLSSHVHVYLVDGHPVTREGLRSHIESTIDMEVCGESGTASTALREIEELEPDVVIAELSLPDAHGLNFIQNVRAQHENVPVIVFSTYHEDVYAERAIRAGAAGYLMKSEPAEAIIGAIRYVQDGEVYLSRRLASRIIARASGRQSAETKFAIDELTDREMTVFRMLGEGRSMEEIQNQLSLSRKTIETHRRRARQKLGLDTVPELLQYAVQWAYGQGINGNSAESPWTVRETQAS